MNHCNCPQCNTNNCPSGVEYNACSAAFDRQQEQLDRNADQLAAAQDEINELRRKNVRMFELAELAEAQRDKAIAILKLMREEYRKLPHSLGYSFTHLPKIDEFLEECGK